MNAYSRITLSLSCLLSVAAGATDRNSHSEDWYANRIECRSIVLVGGYQAGGLICKTHQEWVAHDRAAREKIV